MHCISSLERYSYRRQTAFLRIPMTHALVVSGVLTLRPSGFLRCQISEASNVVGVVCGFVSARDVGVQPRPLWGSRHNKSNPSFGVGK